MCVCEGVKMEGFSPVIMFYSLSFIPAQHRGGEWRVKWVREGDEVFIVIYL